MQPIDIKRKYIIPAQAMISATIFTFLLGCEYPPEIQTEYEQCLKASQENPFLNADICKNIAEMAMIKRKVLKTMSSYCGKANVSLGDNLIWTENSGDKVYHKSGFFYNCHTKSTFDTQH